MIQYIVKKLQQKNKKLEYTIKYLNDVRIENPTEDNKYPPNSSLMKRSYKYIDLHRNLGHFKNQNKYRFKLQKNDVDSFYNPHRLIKHQEYRKNQFI